jgi:hypothetical protein
VLFNDCLIEHLEGILDVGQPYLEFSDSVFHG